MTDPITATIFLATGLVVGSLQLAIGEYLNADGTLTLIAMLSVGIGTILTRTYAFVGVGYLLSLGILGILVHTHEEYFV